MEPEDILGQLNEPQREAVTSGANPVMVPPVPTPATSISKLPLKSLYIS